eukprot:1108983-Prymnesium_polylepis.1
MPAVQQQHEKRQGHADGIDEYHHDCQGLHSPVLGRRAADTATSALWQRAKRPSHSIGHQGVSRGQAPTIKLYSARSQRSPESNSRNRKHPPRGRPRLGTRGNKRA